jgi:predicted nucleic acid-binding protein
VITVADNSPIRYLLLIGEIQLLPALFGSVVIPTAVAEELRHPHTPAPVAEWLERPPSWLQIDTLSHESPLPQVAGLHRGEREAILLAVQRRAQHQAGTAEAGTSAAP